MANHDDLLAEISKRLTDEQIHGDHTYEAYGDAETSPWGAAQWMQITELSTGKVHHLRVTVEPYSG